MSANPWLLVLALAVLFVALSWALNAEIDDQMRAAMTEEEWHEELDYRDYLKTSWFGRDKQAWRALGRPRRDPSGPGSMR